jgi:hypothetical protein
MSKAQIILTRHDEFLRHLAAGIPVIHRSNLFFRDIHYGVLSFFRARGEYMSYRTAEPVAEEVIRELEHRGILRRIDDQTWLLLAPEFQKKRSVPPAPAKIPAAAAVH